MKKRTILEALFLIALSATACNLFEDIDSIPKDDVGDDDDDNNDDNNNDDNNDSTGDSDSDSDSDGDVDNDTEMLCPPGDSQTCNCLGGQEGTQSCNAEGSGWEMCICNDDADTDTGTDEEITYDIIVVSADITGSPDVLDTPDPRLCMEVLTLKACTKYISDETFPVWNQALFSGTITQLTNFEWTISVYDYDGSILGDQFMCDCTFTITPQAVESGLGTLDICGQYVENIVFNFEPQS